MNYIQILQDSLHLFRTTRLIWVFGFLSLLLTLPLNLFQSVRDNPVLACIYLPIFIAVLILTMTAMGALYYVVHQAFLSRNVYFSEAWSQGKSKILRNLGLIVLSIPLLVVGGLFIRLMTNRAPTSPFLWLLFLTLSLFISSFFTFGFCAVVIDNVKVLAAARTSFLITINNFFRVSVITGSMYLIRLVVTALVVVILALGLFGAELPTPLTLDYPTYVKILEIPVVSWINWISNLLLFPLETIMLTLVYLQFTKEVSYPTLAQRHNTA